MIVKAIKIDTEIKKVIETEIQDTEAGIANRLHCETAECIPDVDINGNSVWVDKHACLNGRRYDIFILNGTRYKGSAFVVGKPDYEGRFANCTCSIADVRDRIFFVTRLSNTQSN
jgi:hypothetical protein